MAEQTINKQLSGSEVIEAICHGLRTALSLDDRFAPHVAYSGLGYAITVTVSLPGAVQEQVTRTVAGQAGDVPPDADTVDLAAERPVQSPNEVRLDTEQPLPVLVRDEAHGGTREEWKRVSKHGPPKPGGQRNKVIGAK